MISTNRSTVSRKILTNESSPLWKQVLADLNFFIDQMKNKYQLTGPWVGWNIFIMKYFWFWNISRWRPAFTTLAVSPPGSDWNTTTRSRLVHSRPEIQMLNGPVWSKFFLLCKEALRIKILSPAGESCPVNLRSDQNPAWISRVLWWDPQRTEALQWTLRVECTARLEWDLRPQPARVRQEKMHFFHILKYFYPDTFLSWNIFILK